MSGGNQLLDSVEIVLSNPGRTEFVTVYIDVFDNSLSRKWLTALENLICNNYHLEKNYCFFGFVQSQRNAEYMCEQINQSIAAINQANLGYIIDDFFTVENTIQTGPVGDFKPGAKLIRDKFNQLHRYFEDLQGVSGAMSPCYTRADAETKWHIRQLNLLCHEFESWTMSYRKSLYLPEWQRPSQLMCWLNAPRFVLDEADYELFGIETINRSLGGVYVGVNKAVGKHHWEVFHDEGRDSRLGELTTSTLRSQTEAAGDFDIEWALDPSEYEFQKKELNDFRQWLTANGFDPEDKTLTIGHPKVGQVDLVRSFGTTQYQQIWNVLSNHLDVYKISTSTTQATYEYNWSDPDYVTQQVQRIIQGN
jgi:hypothetical protein